MNRKYNISCLNNRKSSIKFKIPPFSICSICFVFLYSLFALNRMKSTLSFSIGGDSTTNEIWIIPVICLMIFISRRKNNQRNLNTDNLFLLIYIYIYIVLITIGGFNMVSLPQYIYASLLFIAPMFIFFSMAQCDYRYIESFIKFFIVISIIYSVFAIILVMNFAFFMNLLGNNTDNYRYYAQYRAPMMLGSSITVSYYFNITLPLSFYLYYINKGNIWKKVAIISIILNIVATFVLLSRLASLTAFIVVLYYIIFVKIGAKKIKKKIIFILVFMISLFYAYSHYDLSRIFMGFDLAGNSVANRLKAGDLGIYIFTNHPLFGSGIGRYFERVYSNRYITIDNMTAIIDPHNMYILIMSELGFVGLMITMLLFYSLFKNFSNINNIIMKQTSYVTLIVVMINSAGGSQVVNEISYSVVLWIYFGLFQAISLRDRNNCCI